MPSVPLARSRTRLAAGSLALLLVAAPSCAPAEEKAAATNEVAVSQTAPAPQRLMTVSGEGFVMAKPDMASLSVGVVTQGKTAAEATAENTTRMAALFASLKELGIPEKDVQTTNFYVGPRYAIPDPAKPQTESVIVGYDVTNTVTIKVRDLTKLGAAIDRFVGVAAGANSLSGLSFEFANPEPYMDEARKKAVADARRKAELLATAAGVTLGPIQMIAESGFAIPQPFFAGARMEAVKMHADVPISQGESRLATSVTLTYELR